MTDCSVVHDEAMAAATCFYTRLGEGVSGDEFVGTYEATEHCVGPWDERLQHAGPPSALLARAVRMLPGLPPDSLPTRITAEIFRPVPVGRVQVRASIRRPGSRVAWCEATLSAADAPDVPLMRMAAWVMRRTDPIDLPPQPDRRPVSTVGRGTEHAIPPGWVRGYVDAVQWRWVRGSFSEPGRGTAWTWLRVTLVDDEPPDGLLRVLAVADSGSGVSSLANPADLVFLNTDLSVHLYREPVGEYMSMSAESFLDPRGTGMATTVLGDERGPVGVASQALFVAAKPE